MSGVSPSGQENPSPPTFVPITPPCSTAEASMQAAPSLPVALDQSPPSSLVGRVTPPHPARPPPLPLVPPLPLAKIERQTTSPPTSPSDLHPSTHPRLRCVTLRAVSSTTLPHPSLTSPPHKPPSPTV